MKPYGLHKVNGGLCDCPDCGNGNGKIIARSTQKRKALREQEEAEEWTEYEEEHFLAERELDKESKHIIEEID